MLFSPSGIPVVSFSRIEASGDWLAHYLDKNKIEVLTGSPVEHGLLLAAHLREWSADPATVPPGFRAGPALTDALGVVYLASLLRTAKAFGTLSKHERLLRHLALGDPAFTKPGVSSMDRNLTFELQVAALCAASGFQTVTADEPDIRMVRNGEVWDLPCKLVYSPRASRLFENVAKAAEQSRRFGSDYGLAIIGLSSRTDFVVLDEVRKITDARRAPDGAELDTWTGFLGPEPAAAFLQTALAEAVADLVGHTQHGMFASRADVGFRGVLLVAHSVVGVTSVPAVMTAMRLVRRDELFGEPSIAGPEEQLGMALNDTAQRALYK